MRNALAIATLCLALSAGTVWAATLRVPQQFDTIGEAEEAASDGDTILISGGRWFETVNTSKEITFRGARGAVLDGFFNQTRHSVITASADGVKVIGLRIENCGATPVNITGDDALVTGCKFRACDGGVSVDGADARVLRNRFTGQSGTDATIGIDGRNALVTSNQMLFGSGAVINIDAEEGGTATVIGNLIDTQGDDSYIYVERAIAPRVMKNQIRNAYRSGTVIDVQNCDDAVVMKNTLSSINYSVEYGIQVHGARAMVTSNRLQYLNNYDEDLTLISVNGDDPTIQRNWLKGCGAGSDYSLYGIHWSGTEANISRNRLDDLAGGGEYTYGIYLDGDDGVADRNVITNLNDECTYAIYCDGNRARIRSNRITYVMYYYHIYVTGDDFVIQRNMVRNGAYCDGGLYAEGDATKPGAAVIEMNRIDNVGGYGFETSGDDVIIRGNRATRIAFDGFYISGADNILTSNFAREIGGDGFYINGDRNELTGCRAQDCGQDGFDIDGDGNELDKCSATDCSAEGLDNGSGGDTVATNCVLRGSRLDYAGDGNMASDTGTVFTTGGADTSPDNPDED